jgi:hypothetical protein
VTRRNGTFSQDGSVRSRTYRRRTHHAISAIRITGRSGTARRPFSPTLRATQGSIDIVVNLFTPEAVQAGQTGLDANVTSRVRVPDHFETGVYPGIAA